MKKFQRTVRKAAFAVKKGVTSTQVAEVRSRVPGLSLQDSLELAKFENGQLCNRNRDELIECLLVEMVRLSNEVKELKEKKPTW